MRAHTRTLNTKRRPLNSVNSVTVRSSTLTIDNWLVSHPGYVTMKACGHPNASRKATNILAERLLVLLEGDPDSWYHRNAMLRLIDPKGPALKQLTRANRSRLVVLAACI